jgi:hypothetical protein
MNEPCRLCGHEPPHVVERYRDYLELVCCKCRTLIERTPAPTLIAAKVAEWKQRLAEL